MLSIEPISNKRNHIYIYIYIYAYVYAYIYVYLCIYMYIFIYMIYFILFDIGLIDNTNPTKINKKDK